MGKTLANRQQGYALSLPWQDPAFEPRGENEGNAGPWVEEA